MEQFKKLSQYFSSNEIEIFKELEANLGLLAELKLEPEWKNAIFLPGLSPETAKYAYENWTPKEGDIFLAAHMKTGTNWATEIIRQLLYQDSKSDTISKNMPVSFKQLELGQSKKFELMKNFPLKRRFLMTHLPAYLINIDKIKQANAKVVCMLRNPKDQCVSFYNYFQKLPHAEIEPFKSALHSGFEEFLDYHTKGRLPILLRPGEWYPDHILSWYKQQNNINIYFMYYEDMKKDLRGQVKHLAEFLDVSVTEELLNKIAGSCTFDNMKKDYAKEDSIHAKLINVNLQKGEVGRWKEYFTVSQSERIDAMMEEKLKDTDIKFTYQ